MAQKRKVTGAATADDSAMQKRRVLEIIRILEREFPEAHCTLDFQDPFQLLVATVLSAQCTDERVNQVTPPLFAKFPDAQAMSKARIPELERLVKSTGFYKNKARALKEASVEIVEKHGGEVPRTLEELTHLRGVGRKTANVVLGNAFAAPEGIVVDTHVGRVSRRLGLAASTDPDKVEEELSVLVPRKFWTDFPHLIIHHGRETCTARRAYCERCAISRYCPKIGVTPPSEG